MSRCIYEDDEIGRCRRKGIGDPPLCKLHEDSEINSYEEIVSTILEHPAGQKLAGKLNDVLNSALGFIDKLAKQQALGDSDSKPKVVVKKQSPREILHFGPTEPLTVDKIESRKRALAKLVHPDVNGSNEEMAKILNAAKTLKDSLK